MHKYRAYFEKHIPKEIFNEEEREEVFSREEVLFDAMKVFVDSDTNMSANFYKPSIVYKDLSHPHFSLENPNLFYIEQENPKLMPRKGRFYLRDGQIEFVYENREFDALNGETHEYSGPEYLSWYSNDEIEEHLIFDSWTFEANLRHFLVYLLESFDNQIITDMEGLLSLSQKIVDNKIFKDAQVNYSGELMHEIAIELASNLDYQVSPIFRNPDFVKKLEEKKDNFSGLISVINTALLYLVHVYNRLFSNLEHDVNIIKTGREGEEKVMNEVEKTFHFAIKEGYTIAYDEDSFESDIILINETGVHLIEVKNYGSMSQQHQSFEISQDGEMTFYINGRETNARRSPVKQVQRHQALMKKILQDHGHDVPIKAYVVMANDYLSFVNHSDVPVLSLYQVENHLQKGRAQISLEEAQSISQILDQYKRSEKKFPVFNYRKVFDEILEEIVFTTSKFIQDEMYDNFNVDDFMAVSVFADFVLSSMLLEQSYEERAQIIQDMQSKEILQPLEEVIEEMDIFEKIGFFTFPSLLNFMDNKNKRLLFLGANFLLTIGLALSYRNSYFVYRISKGVFASIFHLFQSAMSDIIFWHNFANIALIYYYLSLKKVQDDIFILSQNDYSFWKGNLAEKIAVFLKIPSYRVDQRGNFDYDATVRYNKVHKLFILFFIASFCTYVFSFPIMSFIYLGLFIKNSISIIRKSR